MPRGFSKEAQRKGGLAAAKKRKKSISPLIEAAQKAKIGRAQALGRLPPGIIAKKERFKAAKRFL